MIDLEQVLVKTKRRIKMSFKEVVDLDCESTISLGGRDKKTGKANPTQLEGYFVGSKKTKSTRAKSGFSNLHIFQTENGNIGLWGKTDLDRKMLSVTPGSMTRVTQSGSVPTPNGDMYKYKVEVDASNKIDVGSLESSESASGSDEESYDEESGEDDTISDEVSPSRASAPKRPIAAPDASRQAAVQALLKGRSKAV